MSKIMSSPRGSPRPGKPKGIYYLKTVAEDNAKQENGQKSPGEDCVIFFDPCTVEVAKHPLCKAVLLGSLRLVRTLIEGGVHADSCNSSGQTALMVLCLKQHLNLQSNSSNVADAGPLTLMNFLFEKGADPNVRDHSGKTALMYACALNQASELVNCLLEHGSNPFLEDHIGFTSLTYAYNGKDDAIIKLLSEYCRRQGREVVMLDTKLSTNFLSYLKLQKVLGVSRGSVKVSAGSGQSFDEPVEQNRLLSPRSPIDWLCGSNTCADGQFQWDDPAKRHTSLQFSEKISSFFRGGSMRKHRSCSLALPLDGSHANNYYVDKSPGTPVPPNLSDEWKGHFCANCGHRCWQTAKVDAAVQCD